MRKHPLFFFFFMAYAFSWIISIPYVLSVWGILPGDYNLLPVIRVKAFAGPTLAAIIMTSIIEGKAGLLRLRHRIKQWRAGWQWYLFILRGHSSAALAWDHYPARTRCELSRSYRPSCW